MASNGSHYGETPQASACSSTSLSLLERVKIWDSDAWVKFVDLYGPLGKGFNLPLTASRIVLAALGKASSHLLPLASAALAQNAEVALFTDGDFPQLPAKIEISPLASLADAAGWADYIALSGTWQEVSQAKADPAFEHFRCPAEVLVLVPMPCSALASCGICAITDRQGKVLLACEDGPVFDWGIL